MYFSDNVCLPLFKIMGKRKDTIQKSKYSQSALPVESTTTMTVTASSKGCSKEQPVFSSEQDEIP